MSLPASKDKIAIIGAGPVGLSAARALKLKGIAYDQFESGSAIGGNWRDGVYQTAHIISSRKTTEFPDFKMPEHYPDFPSAQQMLDYLNDYASQYQLLDQIRFNTTVDHVAPCEDGLWEVKLNDNTVNIYEGVVICNGHHWDSRWPDYDGEFTGEMIHSKDYKRPDQLAGKRVLVIGGGNSSCDIASECARVAKGAHLSLRRGYWFLPKTMFGHPTAELLTTKMPVWMQRIYFATLLKVIVGDYRDYGLEKPDHKIFEHHPTINTEVLHYLRHGKITPHPDILRFSGKTVEFTDGTKEEFDMVVFGTGFHVSIPFLAPGVVNIDGPVVKVHWGMVAPHHKQLYIHGWAQARYGFGPLLTPSSELLAEFVLLQRQLRNPLGEVIARTGQPLPKTHLIDPMAALNQIKTVKRMLWMLPLVDKFLMPAGRLNTDLQSAPGTVERF